MNLFSRLLFALCLVFAFSLDSFAQVDEGGGPIVVEDFEAVCDNGTTVFAMLQKVVGSGTVNVVGYVDALGGAYTLSGGPLSAGFCDGGTGTAAIDYTTTVQALCDDGTPFYRVAVFTRDTATAVAINDYELDLSTSYTAAGTVFPGPCNLIRVAGITRIVSTSTGAIAEGAISYEICNRGVTNGTVTIGAGTAATLIPGGCTSFAATLNPITKRYSVSPAIAYSAVGTEFVVLSQF